MTSPLHFSQSRRNWQATLVALTLTAFTVASPSLAFADDEPQFHELKFDTTRDTLLLSSVLVFDVGISLSFARKHKACNWCDRDSQGASTLSSFDSNVRDSLVWENQYTARRLSDVLVLGGLPVFAAGGLYALSQNAGADRKVFLQDAVMVGQAVLITGGVTQIAKLAARRTRPFAHAANQQGIPERGDDTMSFFSGHSSVAFATATSAATIATLRGYKHAPWMWGGLGLAATTGYLRIAGDKHYATDVLVGAAVGMAIGAAVPLLLHGRERDAIAPSVSEAKALDAAKGGVSIPLIGIQGSF